MCYFAVAILSFKLILLTSVRPTMSTPRYGEYRPIGILRHRK